MNMRKIIAVLAAVMMLCSIIPMGAISVSAAAEDNVSTGFEDGTQGKWSVSGSITADAAHTGNYGLAASATGSWGSLLKQTITVTENTAYSISFWYKSNASLTNGAFEMKYKDASDSEVKVPLLNLSNTAITLSKSASEWTQGVAYFATGDYTSINVLFYRNASGAGDAASFYIDDIKMTNLGTVAHDGYYADGGFESGNINLHGSESVSGTYKSVGEISSDAHSGNYAVKGTSTTKYDHYVRQYFRVAKNTDYTIKFWAKASDSDKIVRAYVNAKKFDTDSSKDLRGAYSQHTVKADWEQFELSFNSGENTDIVLSLCSSGSSATFYLDDITVADPNAEPEIPNDAIYSKNFEDGALGGWTSSTSSVVAAADLPVDNADGGSYAMKFVSTYYSYTNYSLAVEKNTTYRVQYSILNAPYEENKVSPLNARVRTNGSVDLAYNQHAGSTTAWQTFSLLFNSGNETTVNLRFQAAHEKNICYIDNVTVTPVDATQKDDGYIKNGDFESGMADNWDYSPGASYAENPDGEGYVLKTDEAEKVNMIAQPVNIIAGQEYVLYFKIYGYSTASNSAIYARFGAPESTTLDANAINTTMSNAGEVPDKWTRQVRLNMNNSTGKWCYAAIPFTALKTTSINVAIYNYRANEGKYYFDDFVVFEKKAASNDGYIVNGDFETGIPGAWTTHQQTTIDAASKYDGNFGVHLMGPSKGYPGVLNQNIVNLEIGVEYEISFIYKAVQQGYNYKVTDSSGTTLLAADGTTKATAYLSKKAWTETSKKFVATETTAKLSFSGSGITEDKDGYEAGIDEVYVDNIVITKLTPAHTHNYVGVETKAPTCTEAGEMTYSCTCGEGTYTESIDALGHTAGAAADCDSAQTCTVCGEVLNAALGHTAGAAADCDSAQVCTVCGIELAPALGHTAGAEADCDSAQVCTVCGAELNAAIGHNYVGEETQAPTCGEAGVMTYTCANCGDSYTEEIAATGEHTYDVDNPEDEDCNVCGYIRPVDYMLSNFGGNSVTEEEDTGCGLAFKYTMEISGIEVKLDKNGNPTNIADFTNATAIINSVSGPVKVLGMGAIVTNNRGTTMIDHVDGKHVIDVPAVYLMDLEEDTVTFAVRIKNIPDHGKDTDICVRPYLIYKDQFGNTIHWYGLEDTTTYNKIANPNP